MDFSQAKKAVHLIGEIESIDRYLSEKEKLSNRDVMPYVTVEDIVNILETKKKKFLAELRAIGIVPDNETGNWPIAKLDHTSAKRA